MLLLFPDKEPPSCRIQKQLPQKTRVKLLFDHDELDMNECIADQDMEDEDMVDVIID